MKRLFDRRAWRRTGRDSPLLTISLLAVFLGALDLTVIATILPEMISDLGVNTADVDRYVWVVNGYLIAYVVAIPLFGRISDVIGRLKTFQISLAIFLIGSIVCAASQTLTTLIAGRTIQGLGGGALLPVTMALIADQYASDRRLHYLGLVGGVDTLGWVTGPIWGAIVVAFAPGIHQHWRWVFWLNIPFALLLSLGLAVLARPGVAPRLRRRGSLDILGATLLAGALVCLNLALASGGELGNTGRSGLRAMGGTPNPLARYSPELLAAAVLLVILLIFWERRAAKPILPLALFQEREFSGAVIANGLIGAALMVGMVNIPVLIALVVTSTEVSAVSALMLAPFTITMAVGALVSGRLSTRFGLRLTASVGILLVLIGYVVLFLSLDADHYARGAIGLVIAGWGFGLLMTPLNGSTLSAAEAADYGAAASTTLMVRLLGMTVGISALTAFGIRRLQTLTDRVGTVVRQPNESTAAFLARQQQFIVDHAIPLSVQVLRETFLIAAIIALLAIIPISFLAGRGPHVPALLKRSSSSASATD